MTEGPDDDGTGEDGAREPPAADGDRERSADAVDPNADDVADGNRDDENGERDAPDDQGSTRDAGPETVAVESDDGETRPGEPDADGTGDDVGTDGSEAGADDVEMDAPEAGADDAEMGADETGAEETESAVAETDASDSDVAGAAGPAGGADVPPDVRKYDKFKKIDGGTYDRANEFLRDRTYITAREWAIARLCADFRTETGVEMTKIGENLPQLVPFMTDTYTPQAVNQARASFEDKVRKSGATFLYGAMCDFFTAQELDDVMYEATEVAKFLLEVEGVELSVDDELEAEDRISEVMREVREHSAALRHDEMTCPECGHEMSVDE